MEMEKWLTYNGYGINAIIVGVVFVCIGYTIGKYIEAVNGSVVRNPSYEWLIALSLITLIIGIIILLIGLIVFLYYRKKLKKLSKGGM